MASEWVLVSAVDDEPRAGTVDGVLACLPQFFHQEYQAHYVPLKSLREYFALSDTPPPLRNMIRTWDQGNTAAVALTSPASTPAAINTAPTATIDLGKITTAPVTATVATAATSSALATCPVEVQAGQRKAVAASRATVNPPASLTTGDKLVKDATSPSLVSSAQNKSPKYCKMVLRAVVAQYLEYRGIPRTLPPGGGGDDDDGGSCASDEAKLPDDTRRDIVFGHEAFMQHVDLIAWERELPLLIYTLKHKLDQKVTEQKKQAQSSLSVGFTGAQLTQLKRAADTTWQKMCEHRPGLAQEVARDYQVPEWPTLQTLLGVLVDAHLSTEAEQKLPAHVLEWLLSGQRGDSAHDRAAQVEEASLELDPQDEQNEEDFEAGQFVQDMSPEEEEAVLKQGVWLSPGVATDVERLWVDAVTKLQGFWYTV